MIELDHVGLRYRGAEGEFVSITVEPQPQNMVWIVTYTLEGQTHVLHRGDVIRFPLVRKPGGDPMVLKLFMDSAPPGGNYHVVLRTVTNEENNECVNDYPVGPESVANYIFFT